MFCTLRTAPKIVLQSLRRMERGLGTGKEERIERACVGWLGRELSDSSLHSTWKLYRRKKIMCKIPKSKIL